MSVKNKYYYYSMTFPVVLYILFVVLYLHHVVADTPLVQIRDQAQVSSLQNSLRDRDVTSCITYTAGQLPITITLPLWTCQSDLQVV